MKNHYLFNPIRKTLTSPFDVAMFKSELSYHSMFVLQHLCVLCNNSARGVSAYCRPKTVSFDPVSGGNSARTKSALQKVRLCLTLGYISLAQERKYHRLLRGTRLVVRFLKAGTFISFAPFCVYDNTPEWHKAGTARRRAYRASYRAARGRARDQMRMPTAPGRRLPRP